MVRLVWVVQVMQVMQVVREVRIISLDDMHAENICFYQLSRIVDMSRLRRTDRERTDGKWKTKAVFW